MAMGVWDRWFPAFSTMLLTILRFSLRLSSVYRRPMVCIRLVSAKGLREWMKEPPFFHGNKEKALQNHLFHLGRQEFPGMRSAPEGTNSHPVAFELPAPLPVLDPDCPTRGIEKQRQKERRMGKIPGFHHPKEPQGIPQKPLPGPSQEKKDGKGRSIGDSTDQHRRMDCREDPQGLDIRKTVNVPGR